MAPSAHSHPLPSRPSNPRVLLAPTLCLAFAFNGETRVLVLRAAPCTGGGRVLLNLWGPHGRIE